jgi:hypothetical protein
MPILVLLLLLVLAPTAAASLPASELAPIHGPYSPKIDPANFEAKVDNRYLPFEPGTRFHYKGVRGTTPQTDNEVVLRKTKRVLGVTCTVVRDTVSEHGHPVERTFDWYAQDRDGNVWYMGENSLELKNGRFVRASDSWRSGVNGAKPGIIMPGHPRGGESYRQEYYPPGEALDEARVLGIQGSVTVPFGTFEHALVTLERSPAGAPDREKVLRQGRRRGEGAGGQGAPRAVRARERDASLTTLRQRVRALLRGVDCDSQSECDAL